MQAAELRDLSLDELRAKSAELRSDLFNVHVKHATGQLENTAQLGNLRRQVARVETVIREKRGAEQ
jgi:large subunit ribosomal protein L29